LRRAAEQRGDPIGFFLSLAAAHPRATDLPSEFERLARIARRRALSNPDAFAKEILDHGLSAAGFLHFRLVYYIDRLLSNYDLGRDGGASLPKEVVDVLLPALMQLDRHVADLTVMRATMARQAELARAKKIENDLAEMRNQAVAKTTAETPVNGKQVAVNGVGRKKATRKNGRVDNVAVEDPLEATLACDVPSEQQSIARIAARMGSVEFDTTGAPLPQ
jgi:hypothetical protein